MSYVEDTNNPYQAFGTFAAEAVPNERAEFIRKTYAHLLGAILAFVGLEAVIVNSPLAESMARLMMGNGAIGWIVVLVFFMGANWLAGSWANSTTSVGMQYAGLALTVVAWTVIFAPILWIAANFAGPNVIPTAGLVTVLTFGGLTAGVFITKKDFSFLGPILGIISLAALAFIVCALIFQFEFVNTLFIVAMIAVACGWILYDTSNVLHRYRIGQHVAASVALFSSIALLFWYVLQLFMSRD